MSQNGGQIIVDEGGNIFLRFDDNMNDRIAQYTAMTIWDDKLIMGRGRQFFPDLVYADWDTVTEEKMINSNSSQHAVIASQWRTKNLDFDLPDVQKQVRKIWVIYRDCEDWTDKTITVKYRLDTATGTGDDIPSWTTLGSISLGAATGTKHIVAQADFDTLQTPFYTIQFQFEADDVFEIMGMNIYYHVHSIQ